MNVMSNFSISFVEPVTYVLTSMCQKRFDAIVIFILFYYGRHVKHFSEKRHPTVVRLVMCHHLERGYVVWFWSAWHGALALFDTYIPDLNVKYTLQVPLHNRKKLYTSSIQIFLHRPNGNWFELQVVWLAAAMLPYFQLHLNKNF